MRYWLGAVWLERWKSRSLSTYCAASSSVDISSFTVVLWTKKRHDNVKICDKGDNRCPTKENYELTEVVYSNIWGKSSTSSLQHAPKIWTNCYQRSKPHCEDRWDGNWDLPVPCFSDQERNELLRELSALKWHSCITSEGSTQERGSHQHPVHNHMVKNDIMSPIKGVSCQGDSLKVSSLGRGNISLQDNIILTMFLCGRRWVTVPFLTCWGITMQNLCEYMWLHNHIQIEPSHVSTKWLIDKMVYRRNDYWRGGLPTKIKCVNAQTDEQTYWWLSHHGLPQ